MKTIDKILHEYQGCGCCSDTSTAQAKAQILQLLRERMPKKQTKPKATDFLAPHPMIYHKTVNEDYRHGYNAYHDEMEKILNELF